jgi:predicted transcriptional regulator
MNSITIQLPDDRLQQLQKLAQAANVLPEDLLRAPRRGMAQWSVTRFSESV